MTTAHLRHLALGDSLVLRAARFAVIGLANGLVYAAVVAALVHGANVAPTAASIAGYCAAVPVGFVGHRRLSFRSHGRWTAEAIRFVLIQAVNILVTGLTMQVTTAGLHVSYVWGMAATVVLIPLTNFACLNFWVFRQGMAQQGSNRR